MARARPVDARMCVRKSESGSELRLVGQWWNEEKRKEGRRESEREREGRLNGGCTREGDNRGVGPGG